MFILHTFASYGYLRFCPKLIQSVFMLINLGKIGMYSLLIKLIMYWIIDLINFHADHVEILVLFSIMISVYAYIKTIKIEKGPVNRLAFLVFDIRSFRQLTG